MAPNTPRAFSNEENNLTKNTMSINNTMNKCNFQVLFHSVIMNNNYLTKSYLSLNLFYLEKIIKNDNSTCKTIGFDSHKFYLAWLYNWVIFFILLAVELSIPFD